MSCRIRVSLERRALLRGAGAVALLSAVPGWLWAQDPEAAHHLVTRLWPSQEYTRLVIESPEQLSYKFLHLKDPERLVFDFPHQPLLDELALLSLRVDANDPYIAAIRTGDRDNNVLRLVVDLKGEVDPQVFTLLPVEGRFGYRLVIDIYPKVAFDPLLWLVREFEAQDNMPALEAKYANDEELLALVHAYEKKSEATSPQSPPPKKTTTTSPTTKPPTPPPEGESRSTRRTILVMIDPGHGGEDPGAVGKRGTQEKKVVLAIARQMKKLIDAQPNMRAVLTRDGDYFVPLHTRVDKARRIKADVMVSVHADAFTRRSARGSSVFVLSSRGASSAAARWLARKENDADLVGGVNIKANKDSVLTRTLLDMQQAAQIKSSLSLGDLVLKELGRHNALHKGVVEQASFAVLKAPDVPSILVETAFISNPEEEEKLRSAEHQERFAQSIVQGLVRFFKV